ncbi:MAG: nuclear transport factor 2 family protein [Alsobacter sp.]
MGETQAAINARIDRFVALLAARDPAIVDELWSERGFRLVGSEKGEVFRTRDDLARKFVALFALPRQLVFDWPRREIEVEGDIAWAFVEGDLVYRTPDADERRTYNATFIFQRLGDAWRWRQFFGSEPA